MRILICDVKNTNRRIFDGNMGLEGGGWNGYGYGWKKEKGGGEGYGKAGPSARSSQPSPLPSYLLQPSTNQLNQPTSTAFISVVPQPCSPRPYLSAKFDMWYSMTCKPSSKCAVAGEWEEEGKGEMGRGWRGYSVSAIRFVVCIFVIIRIDMKFGLCIGKCSASSFC